MSEPGIQEIRSTPRSGRPGSPREDGDARLGRIIDSMADAVLAVDGDGVVQFTGAA